MHKETFLILQRMFIFKNYTYRVADYFLRLEKYLYRSEKIGWLPFPIF